MDELTAAGWTRDMAEALEGMGYNTETAAVLSPGEALNVYLEWNGMIGWTATILAALANAKQVLA